MSTNKPENGAGAGGVPKRKLACNQCRVKKAKCDGNTPCSGCKAALVNCVYSAPRKRGVPSGYLQKLERENDYLKCLLQKFMETSTNAWDTVAQVQGALAEATPEVKAELKRRFSLPLSNEPDANALLQQRSRENDDNDMAESQNQTDNELRNLGLTSGFDKSFVTRFQRLQLSGKGYFDVNNWANLIQPCHPVELLEIYFTYCNPIYPMLDKSELVQLSYSPDRCKMTSKSCLWWTVVLQGLNHTSIKKPAADNDRSKAVYDLAFCTLDCSHSLETVQALLIQALFFLGKGYWGYSWLMVGNAVRTAMDLGLSNHEMASGNYFERRTWKCCCIIDSIISGRMGRVPQVQSNIGHFFDESEDWSDSLEEWELWKPFAESARTSESESDGQVTKKWVSEPSRAISIFNAFYTLNEIANRFITVVNKPSKSTDWSEESKTDFLAKTAKQVTEWAQALPPHIKLHIAFEDTGQLLPHNANLIFTYISVCSLIYAADGNSERYATYGLPTCQQLIDFIQCTTSIFRSYFSLNKIQPTFEYFHTVLITVLVRKRNSGNRDPLNTVLDSVFDKFLENLKSCSSTWGGSLIPASYLERYRDYTVQANSQDLPTQLNNNNNPFEQGFSSFLTEIYHEFFNAENPMVSSSPTSDSLLTSSPFIPGPNPQS